MRDLIDVGLDTGARPGDILALTWPRVDLTAGKDTILEDKKDDRPMPLDPTRADDPLVGSPLQTAFGVSAEVPASREA